jgi:hypothetical protein
MIGEKHWQIEIVAERAAALHHGPYIWAAEQTIFG